MFEKEAEEYLKKDGTETEQMLNNITLSLTSRQAFVLKNAFKQTFKDGAEFGYNKANEWHYVKDGDLPKDKKNFKSYVVAYYGAIGSIANGKSCWEELCYDTENKRWVDKETLEDIPYVNQEGIVIAWKEIVLPKESE